MMVKHVKIGDNNEGCFLLEIKLGFLLHHLAEDILWAGHENGDIRKRGTKFAISLLILFQNGSMHKSRVLSTHSVHCHLDIENNTH